MSNKHNNLLRTVMKDPLSANVHWREVESLLKHLGADLEPSHGARFKATLNGVTEFLHHPHHSSVCTKDFIKQLREFLTHAGVTLAAEEKRNEG